ncbi:MAG TPA: NEW3 domain-containing protein [Solirubrobacteraceae bacterium]|nr:NEW3 domain-containing protein [Solirubrobacteraceae bacterium]
MRQAPFPRARRALAPLVVLLAALAATLGAPSAATADTLSHVPTLPVNACHDSSLPPDYGTNFPTPDDPYGFGYGDETAIGWENNIYAPFAYLSGSYFARGVPTTYDSNGTTLCGAMYSFGAYTYGLPAGQAPPPQSVHWRMAQGYLPAMITSFTRDGVAISITDFADRQTIAGRPVELVYTRVRVTNESSSPVDVPPGASGPNLVALTNGSDTVAPGQTVDHDYVAAVDTFDTTSSLPTVAELTPSATNPGAASYQTAFRDMVHYWNERLSVIPMLSLPNLRLPHTGRLSDPGARLEDAYKAAFIYTRIVQVADAPFSAANNYSYLLNHDAPGILMNRFALGDFTDAHSLLLNARISEQPGFDEHGANWYWDGLWRTPIAWAQYLQGTNDVSFVRRYFAHTDSRWGPSLKQMMHTDYLTQLSSSGYLQRSNDNDSEGTWLFDDETALAGLAAYRYIATRIGDAVEARWANGAYDRLLGAVNQALAQNEQANGFDFLPCEVDVPITADRCNTANDANWAGSNLWGQNVWDIFLQGGRLDGILGDPSQTDNLYEMGFSRLAGTGVPFPSFGAYSGYSVALNTAYAQGALYGEAYRDLPITSYAWQIASTTGGPNAWWEANGTAPSRDNPWVGRHAMPEFGASPYAWPMAGQTQSLLQSIVAPGLTATSDGHGGFAYTNDLYIGRGIPDRWIAPGRTIAVSNLTAAYDVATGRRTTYGVRIETVADASGGRTVQVTLTGSPPAGDVEVQLPVFADAGVQGVSGGAYDSATHTLTMSGDQASVQLGQAAPPTIRVHVANTAPGRHAHPALLVGVPTTARATITNTGATPLANVHLTPSLPSGWTLSATSPTEFASIAPGQSATATWTVTPPDSTAAGETGAGVVIDATYMPSDGAAGSASAEEWVTTQAPLPLPPGTKDLALSATPSASYTSPWTTLEGLNSGIMPVQSADDNDLTPYWGDWPQNGTQWVEYDWKNPIMIDSTAVYWAWDGGGLQVPSSWTVQYWNGSAWTDVSGQSGDPTALNQFNWATFDPVTTTRLRLSMQSTGTASVGIVQWMVPSGAHTQPPGT